MADPNATRERIGSELPELVSEWPPHVLEELAEREAILEFDARMPRERAQRAAEHIVRDRYRRGLL